MFELRAGTHRHDIDGAVHADNSIWQSAPSSSLDRAFVCHRCGQASWPQFAASSMHASARLGRAGRSAHPLLRRLVHVVMSERRVRRADGSAPWRRRKDQQR